MKKEKLDYEKLRVEGIILDVLFFIAGIGLVIGIVGLKFI